MEAELAEHLDLGALARPQAEDDGFARDELDQVAEAAVEARPRLGHGRVREAVAEPKDLVELLPLVVDVLVVRVVLAVDEPFGVGRQQALGVVVLRAHGMLVPLVHVPGVRVVPERAVVAEAARRPPVERLPEPERCDPAQEPARADAPVRKSLHGADDTVSPDEAERRRRHVQWPQALHAVLLGLADQSDPDFDLVVADDGSGPDTAALAEAWKAYLRLTHVRQDDDGYRLARVRNLGAQEARGDYLVFLNSDTVPRRHFVRAMRKAAVPGWFLAGKRLLLSAS